jgi:carboxypeptidase D
LQAPFFRQSPYARLTIDGLDHGIVREHGNLSFAVIYDAGHMVPVDKPDVALEIFRRSLSGLDIATGTESVLDDSTVPFVPDDPIASSSPDALLSPSILYPLGR